jgi:hypothetical protein
MAAMKSGPRSNPWQAILSFAPAVFLSLAVLGSPVVYAAVDPAASDQPAQAPSGAEPSSAGLELSNVSHWKFEELHLTDGRVLPGLIKDEDASGVDFLEIRRPADRPMFFVMYWRFPIDKIDHLVRLPEADRKLLIARVAAVRERSRVEEQSQAKIQLQHSGDAANGVWRYGSDTWRMADGRSWLVVDSTADEETTRRSIVRIEQMFTAYREILPPHVRPTKPLSIKLFGTMREYKEFLSSLHLSVENPAVFVADENMLVAGSELSTYAEQLHEVRRRHAALKADYDQRDKSFADQLTVLRKQLKVGGFSIAEQHTIIQLSQARWKDELGQINRQIDLAERRNLDQFNRLTAGMFARLFHEAFHAYLENYVYPEREYDVPRWLNEGLAQIFETGQLEAGTLRLDAPHAERLQMLQKDLRSSKLLSLADVLNADGREFLVFHPGGAAASQRYYLYSWGLAYYLAFRQPVLQTPALQRYADRSAASEQRVARFERLVGMPLDQFESRWRTEMLKLKSSN